VGTAVGVGVGTAVGVGVGAAVGVGVGCAVGVGVGPAVGVGVGPAVGVGVGAGVGVGDAVGKIGGRVGSGGIEAVGVGVTVGPGVAVALGPAGPVAFGFAACDAAVRCAVRDGDGASATALFVALGDFSAAAPFDSACCGPSQKKSSNMSPNKAVMPRRLKVKSLLRPVKPRSAVMPFVSRHQSMTGEWQARNRTKDERALLRPRE